MSGDTKPPEGDDRGSEDMADNETLHDYAQRQRDIGYERGKADHQVYCVQCSTDKRIAHLLTRMELCHKHNVEFMCRDDKAVKAAKEEGARAESLRIDDLFDEAIRYASDMGDTERVEALHEGVALLALPRAIAATAPKDACPNCGRGRSDHRRVMSRDSQGRRVTTFVCNLESK